MKYRYLNSRVDPQLLYYFRETMQGNLKDSITEAIRQYVEKYKN